MTTPFDLNLRHLEAAGAVGERGGISAAAQAVNLSQPALTQALSKLEARVGRRLFDRHPGGVEATEAGLILTRRIERALALLAEAVREARRGARLPTLHHPARHLAMTQLRALLAVDRAGGYVAAAAETGLSQPGLHNAVRELEAVVGVPLLVRQGRAVRSSPAAARFLRPARLAIAELQAGLDEIEALSAGGAGRVVIGAMPLSRSALLPATVTRFAEAYPNARVRIVDGPYADLLAGLSHGELDLLIGALRDPSPAPDVVQEGLFEDRLYVVCRAGHPLAADAGLAEMAAYPWVMAAPGAPLHARWRAMFETRGVAPPPVAVECGSIIAIRGLLLSGDWLTVLSPDQFKLEERMGLLTRIGGPISGSERLIGVTTRRDWQPTGVQQAFLDHLRNEVARTRNPETE